MRHAINILVADSDEGIQALLADILPLYANADVVLVKNGQEAMERLTEPGARSIDLVITGVAMTPVNGVELTAEIKKLSPQTPVIMLSGSPEPKEHSADVFISKPFDAHFLFKNIGQLIVEATRE